MKICPSCQNRYTDDTLQYCLQDGTPLVNEEDQTAAPTVAFNSEPETVVRPREPEKIEFDLQEAPAQPRTRSKPASATAVYEEPKRSNTALIVTATVLTTVLVLGAAGIGAWLYFSKNEQPTAPNSNIKASFPVNTSKNANAGVSPSPEASPSPTTEKTPEPTPKADPEQIRKEVSDTVYSWGSLAESRNLSAYMSKYADRVDYYTKSGVSATTVRADKQKAFSTFDLIEMDISNLRVTIDDAGETATAVFDKEWYFENDQRSTEGKAQSQLKFKKIGGAWKIVSEKDLKVYYTN